MSLLTYWLSTDDMEALAQVQGCNRAEGTQAPALVEHSFSERKQTPEKINK